MRGASVILGCTFHNRLKTMPRLLVRALVLSVLLSGCEPLAETPEDTTAPSVQQLTLLPSSGADPGDTVRVNAHIEDASGLSEIRLEIHDIFDGHGHSGKTTATQQFRRYAETRIIDAEDAESLYISEPFVIPEDAAAGPYALHVEVLDVFANRAPMQVREFEVRHPSLPTLKDISFNGVESEGPLVINYSNTQRLNVAANMSDTDGLSSFTLRINPVDEFGRMGEPVVTHIQSLAGLTDYDLSLELSLAELSKTGEYALLLLVQDTNGLTKRYRKPLLLNP